jgi:hypothetical protein
VGLDGMPAVDDCHAGQGDQASDRRHLGRRRLMHQYDEQGRPAIL